MIEYKMIFVLFLSIVILFVSGCSDIKNNENTPETTSTVTEKTETTTTSSASESTVTSTTSVVTEPVTTSGDDTESVPVTEEDTSLTKLRQSMTDKEMMAVIYFDHVDYMNETVTYDLMKERSASVCDSYPFVSDIPAERIIGEPLGDLFCIIPRDEASTIAINRMYIDENGEFDYNKVIYRSESGEPVLLYCNNSGFDADTQVNITDLHGNTFTWYPATDDHNGVAQVYDDEYNNMICDLTSYRDLLTYSYNARKDEGWVVPTAEQLIGTSWGIKEYRMDGTIVDYMLDIHENTVAVQWNDGISTEDHRYPDAKWEYICENGIAMMKIDFREFAGELTYAILLSDEGSGMYTYIDFTEDDVTPRWLKTDRYLARTYG